MTNLLAPRSRIPALIGTVALLSGVPAAIPASATPPIRAGVTVTAVPLTIDEGETLAVEAVYDETGGEPTGDFLFLFGDTSSDTVAPVDLDPTYRAATTHTFADDGEYVVIVRVPVGSATYRGVERVTVGDVSPVLDAIPDAIAGKGLDFDLEVSFTDPGVEEEHTITVDWGDGSSDVVGLDVGSRSLTVTHVYSRVGGPFAATVTVEDVGNGADSVESFGVTVAKACGGKPVTIDMRKLAVTTVTGTAGDDVILGTPGDDVIDGGDGNDTVCGKGGDDRIDGQGGNDDLRGGTGGDVLIGGDGDDELRGGPGTDHLDGDDGADYLDGGGHDDSVFGDAGNDILRGGYGNDRLIGGLGDDDLNGGGGNDEIRGAAGDDVLRGGNAADRLFGGTGDDVLLGGNGPDVLEGSSQNDVLHGGAGADDLDGGPGTDLLFVSEYPDRDTMDGGDGDDAVRVGKRGDLDGRIRYYATEAEALAFQGSYLLSGFTTYHSCCENRVVNIQLMADSVSGHIVMPGEAFSVNDVVGRRTEAKGYKPAGAIIEGYVQCCDFPENIGGGTSQFATTIYNAVFFSGMKDLEHQPHTAWFSRYPQGREATMGYPHPDVKFRNNTDHPMLITTHHDGYRGTSIGVKFWGDNERIEVTAGSRVLARYNKVVRWKINTGLSYCSYPGPEGNRSGAKRISIGTDGLTVEVYQYIDYPGGDRVTNTTRWRYVGNYEVWEYNPYAPAGGCGGDDGGGGGGGGGFIPN
jgi:Ca2+-binding RTX toxin-like protein